MTPRSSPPVPDPPAHPPDGPLHLPLSWHRTPLAHPRRTTFPLPRSRRTWIATADVPPTMPFSDALARIDVPSPVIRGCSPGIAARLKAEGAAVVAVGSEAILDLSHVPTERRSLRELVRRGRRWGVVRPIGGTEGERDRFAELYRHSRHGGEPQLRGLFRTALTAETPAYVFESREGRWLGGLTLTRVAPGYLHTEIIARRPDAPVGTMEALIAGVHAARRAAGDRWLSLGEVPFILPRETTGGWSRVLRWSGPLQEWVYHARGLYRFKGKFRPHWRPLYLCAMPAGIGPAMWWDLMVVSGYRDLVRYRMRG